MGGTMTARSHQVIAGGFLLVLAVLCAVCLPAVAPADEAPALTLTATPATVAYGSATRIVAQGAVQGDALTLSSRLATQSEFTVIDTAVADAAGKAVWTRRPRFNVTYRVDFAGAEADPTAGAEATVAARPRVNLRVETRKPVLKGRRLVFTITVRPAHPGGAVQLQRRTADGWVVLKDLLLDDASAARFSWRADKLGTLIVRARMAADIDHAAGYSARWRTTVYHRRNPYGVPTRIPRLILVDLSKYKLYYHEHGQVIRVFDCVLGRPGLPTPKGRFKIYAKDPSMYGPYGPKRMRYLGLYAIHGTNEPWLLNRYPRNFSHGCTRLSNTHIRWLFSRARVGTPVWNVP